MTDIPSFERDAHRFSGVGYGYLLASLFSGISKDTANTINGGGDDLDWAAWCFDQADRYARFAAMTPEGDAVR